MTVDQIAREITAEIKAEETVRARLANNGRNPANNNAGIRVGSDLHLCEMLLRSLDTARAALNEKPDFKAMTDNLRLRAYAEHMRDRYQAYRDHGGTEGTYPHPPSVALLDDALKTA